MFTGNYKIFMMVLPAFGGAGCGIATAIVITVMFISTLVYTHLSRRLAHYALFSVLFRPDFSKLPLFVINLLASLSIYVRCMKP